MVKSYSELHCNGAEVRIKSLTITGLELQQLSVEREHEHWRLVRL
nr:MAG TPA: hypothetical protein [Bacteriophage sp.]